MRTYNEAVLVLKQIITIDFEREVTSGRGIKRGEGWTFALGEWSVLSQ